MINKKIKEYRKLNNLTQKEVAKILKMSITGYASWEQGLAEPSTEDIKRLSIIFNTTPNELLEFEEMSYNFIYKHNKTTLIHKEK